MGRAMSKFFNSCWTMLLSNNVVGQEMHLFSSLLECKYFHFGTIVRRGVRVEVGVEIYVESSCAGTPDCELHRRQQAIIFNRNTDRY